jgi:hypothetical protein
MALAPLVSLAHLCKHESDGEDATLRLHAVGLLVLLMAAVMVVLEPLSTAASR